MDIEPTPLTGKIARWSRPSWVTFEMDVNNSLHIRTINGLKIISDPVMADEIMRTLISMVRIEEQAP
jgi:pantothenate kinase